MFNKLQTRIFLAMTLLVVIGVGGAAAITVFQGNKIALDEARQSVARSRAIQENTATHRFQNLLLINQLISSDPYFAAYIGQAAGADLGFGDEEEVDTASIVDLIDERNQSLKYQYGVGFDFAYVLDTEGYLLASDARMPVEDTAFVDDILFDPLISDLETVTGYWSKHDTIYQVAGVPLASDDELVGFFVLGLAADEEFVSSIKETSGTEYALFNVVADQIETVAGSLSPEAVEELSGMVKAGQSKFIEVNLDGQHWLANVGSLDDDQEIGIAVTLVSLDDALAGFSSLSQLIGLVAMGTTILAVTFGFLISSRTVRPLIQLAEAADEAAKGNFRAQFDDQGGGQEITQLTHSLSSLLSDLREKSDMENFMESLAKLQPEGEEEAGNSLVEGSHKPEIRNATLLGFEFKELMDSERSPEDLSKALQQAQRSVAAIVKKNGGVLLPSVGYRAIAYFTGNNGLKAAVSSVPAVEAVLTDKIAQPVAAIVRGKIVTATIRNDGVSRQVSLGKSWLLLDRLLSEAQRGYLLTSKNTAVALEGELTNLNAVSATGVVTGKKFPGYPMNSLSASETFIETEFTVSGTVTSLDQVTALTVDDVKPGYVLNDRYEIISQIGKGAMGTVFKSYDRELNDVIALKLMSLGMEQRMVDMMKSEIRLARKVTDQHILRTFDFGEVDGLPFLSMEYVRGMTLKYVIDNTGNLPFSAAVRVSRQLCHALLAAHQEGITHRDIKPANIMLDFTGKVKLMDFGLAGTVAGDRTHGGTPNYASPEQLLGLDVKTSGDVYSCGVVLYELFTGKLPFKLHGRSLKEMARSQQAQEPVPPVEIVGTLPPQLSEIIMAAIAKEPDDRPTSISQIVGVLDSIRA